MRAIAPAPDVYARDNEQGFRNATRAELEQLNASCQVIRNVTDQRLLGRWAGTRGLAQEVSIGAGLNLSAGGVLTGTGASATLTNTHIFVGNASNVATDVAVSGDVTITNTGVVTVANNAITYAKMQDVSATSRILGRKTAGAGDPEECTLSDVLDFIGSAAQGDVLYRGASTWSRLGAGTSGQFLQTLGASANPAWGTPTGGTGGGFWSDILSATPTVSGTGLSNYLGTGAASANTSGGVNVSGTSGGMGAYTTSVPSTPYSITALLACNTATTTGNAVTGLGWTDGTKVHIAYLDTTGKRIILRFSNITTASTADATFTDTGYNRSFAWLKIADDGTNVTFSYSSDGHVFVTLFTVAKASGYLGATGYTHIFVGSPGGTGANNVVVISWTQGV